MTDPQNRYQSKQQKVAAKRFRIFATAVTLLCLLVGFICFWFYGQVQKNVREESSGYLKEVSARVAGNIQQIIGDTYSSMNALINTFDQSDADSFADFEAIVAGDQKHWKYEAAYLVDANGKAYDMAGKPFILTGDIYLRNVVLGGSESMSPLQLVNGKECAIFAVPLNGRLFDGIPMEALAVTYDADTFAQVLSMSSFNQQAYSHIVSKDGTMIIRSDYNSGARFGYNVFSSIDQGHIINSDTSTPFEENIRNDLTGQIEFELDGRQEYMVYTPIPPDDWYLLTFVPTDVVNAKSNMLLAITLLISGFITASFTIVLVTTLLSTRRHQKKLERIAYVDDVTDGNTIGRFYELARDALDIPNHPTYALVYSNISKFKVLNENFGRPTGDDILQRFYHNIDSCLKGQECLGRLSADNFCMLMEYSSVEELCNRFEQWFDEAAQGVEKLKPVWALPITEFGVYIIENDTMPFPLMIDRAKLALQEVPRSINARLRYAVYNDQLRAQLFREKQLEDMMESALERGEFQMYLQPKFRVEDETIVGAEALARWVSASEGMIFPDEFIPLFEKNGFIIHLDLWIFEETCRFLRSLIDQGENPVKISVNCSRAHLLGTGLAQTYRKVATQYDIPPNLLEIELTESLVLEDSELFKTVVEELHMVGFSCSMDDFGSGYSSLNMIQDLMVDTIKMDKIFFRNSARDPVRTESVLGNMIRMAKALSMETVAEGVEQPEQVDMLRRMGCDLIQGYVFAKPMPSEEFRRMLLNRS